MLKKFISIFLSRLPDRFAYLVIVVSIISLGSFAYDNVGLPIQTASAQTSASTNVSSADTAIDWISMQGCFGDHINADTINTAVSPAGDGAQHVAISFVSLEYSIDQATGRLHHLPVNHTVNIILEDGRVVSAVEGLHDLANGQTNSPLYGATPVLGREF